jgi:raffinose/stachyose/melibiose transport system permease protein
MNQSKKIAIPSIIMKVFLIAQAIVCLYPLFYLLFYSFKSNEEIFFTNPFGIPAKPLFENYVKDFNTFDMVGFFKNSMVVSFLSLVGILLLTIPFAYALNRMRWRLKGVVASYIMLGLFIPIQVIIIPLAILVKDLHLNRTYFAVILPYVAFNIAFSTLVLGVSMNSILKEMEESAFIDGASVYRCLISIILPLVKPAVATTMIFNFLNVWNEYTVASILITQPALKTLPVGLSSFIGERSTEWGPMGACLVLASIPTIIMYIVFSEQVEKALTIGGAVKG